MNPLAGPQPAPARATAAQQSLPRGADAVDTPGADRQDRDRDDAVQPEWFPVTTTKSVISTACSRPEEPPPAGLTRQP